MDASNSLRVTAKRNFTSSRGFQQCIQECYEVALTFLNNFNPVIFLHYKSSSQLGQAFDDLKQKSVFPTRLEFSKLTKFCFFKTLSNVLIRKCSEDFRLLSKVFWELYHAQSIHRGTPTGKILLDYRKILILYLSVVI